jgi:hypothetical protein
LSGELLSVCLARSETLLIVSIKNKKSIVEAAVLYTKSSSTIIKCKKTCADFIGSMIA